MRPVPNKSGLFRSKYVLPEKAIPWAMTCIWGDMARGYQDSFAGFWFDVGAPKSRKRSPKTTHNGKITCFAVSLVAAFQWAMTCICDDMTRRYQESFEGFWFNVGARKSSRRKMRPLKWDSWDISSGESPFLTNIKAALRGFGLKWGNQKAEKTTRKQRKTEKVSRYL